MADHITSKLFAMERSAGVVVLTLYQGIIMNCKIILMVTLGLSLLITADTRSDNSFTPSEQLAVLENVRAEKRDGSLLVLVELDRPASYSIMHLDDPLRIVLDFPDTKVDDGLHSIEVGGTQLRAVRWAQLSFEPLVARVVLDVEFFNIGIPEYDIGSVDNDLQITFSSSSNRKAVELDPGNMHELDRRIDLSVEGASIGSVIKMISENYDLNIIADGELSGTVTTKLKGVTIDDALSAILRVRGYNYIRQGDIIIVKEAFEGKSDMVTRLFKLDYVDAEAVKNVCLKYLSEEGNIESFSGNLREKSNSMLEEERIFSSRNDALLVTDYPDALNTIASVVRELDIPVAQVMIEVKFVERSITGSQQLGFDWNIDGKFTGKVPVDPALQALAGSAGEIETYNKLYGDGDFTFGQLKLEQFNVVLQLLEQTGNAKLLSNPRIATLNNHEAQIAVGTKILIPIREREASSDIILETFEEMDIGINLSVIPHIHKNGDITLQVHPRVEQITGYTGEFNDRPIIAERTATTQIKVKEGETIAIGGLIREVEIETIQKVPFLGSIPLLKYLFTHRSKSKEKTDLLIFITPKLMPETEG